MHYSLPEFFEALLLMLCSSEIIASPRRYGMSRRAYVYIFHYAICAPPASRRDVAIYAHEFTFVARLVSIVAMLTPRDADILVRDVIVS